MNFAYTFKQFNIDLQYQDSFPGGNYVRWAELPKADTYVVHLFHDDTIPTLLPFLQELQIPICVVADFDEGFFWMGMLYDDFERLYDVAAPSLNYSYCIPDDKEYEMMHSREVDGELLSEGHTHYVIGNGRATDEGCEGCGKVVVSNRKRAFCPNCGEDVYMS